MVLLMCVLSEYADFQEVPVFRVIYAFVLVNFVSFLQEDDYSLYAPLDDLYAQIVYGRHRIRKAFHLYVLCEYAV